MASSSSPTSSGGDAPGPNPERAARPLLVDRIAELEEEHERLAAANAELERENERLERKDERLERRLRRRRRERQDVIDRYERQLRRRTAELERERDRSDERRTGARGRIAAVLAIGRRFAERCPGFGSTEQRRR
ncbi:hypothetical protein [Halobellus sp. EA9]|uniref:hypothetical protein n=1 Tax=Halobellus sp. EA9 TaxID=3421647 RepID=UPI003EBC22D1